MSADGNGGNAEFTVRADGALALVEVRGELDAAEAEQLFVAVRTAWTEQHLPIAVDLSAVTFFGSAAVAALVKARLLVVEEGASLVVRRPSPIAARVLAITGLETTFGLPSLDGGEDDGGDDGVG